ncbi:MAG: metalloregulator ArsR/SmtB family transcription factor [Chloroflexota bacterium]
MIRTAGPDVTMLQALADPTRLAIVRQLSADGEVCACDFSACCDVAQPTVSHHLRVLREAGIVISERRGTWIIYRLAPEAVDRLRAIVGSLQVGGAGDGVTSGSRAARPSLPVVQPVA